MAQVILFIPNLSSHIQTTFSGYFKMKTVKCQGNNLGNHKNTENMVLKFNINSH